MLIDPRSAILTPSGFDRSQVLHRRFDFDAVSKGAKKVPTVLGDEERQLLEQLDERLDDDAYAPRDDDLGFFGRLKSALR